MILCNIIFVPEKALREGNNKVCMYVCIILLALCRQLKSSHFHPKVEKQYAVYVLQCNFNGRGNWYNSHRAIPKEI